MSVERRRTQVMLLSKPKKSKKPLIITLIAVFGAALIAGVIIVILLLQGSSSTAKIWVLSDEIKSDGSYSLGCAYIVGEDGYVYFGGASRLPYTTESDGTIVCDVDYGSDLKLVLDNNKGTLKTDITRELTGFDAVTEKGTPKGIWYTTYDYNGNTSYSLYIFADAQILYGGMWIDYSYNGSEIITNIGTTDEYATKYSIAQENGQEKMILYNENGKDIDFEFYRIF